MGDSWEVECFLLVSYVSWDCNGICFFYQLYGLKFGILAATMGSYCNIRE